MPSVTCARAYVLAFSTLEIIAYAALVWWNATTLWGAPDTVRDNSQVPVLSLGFATSPAIMWFFISGLILIIIESSLFWALQMDKTPYRIAALSATPFQASIWWWCWAFRVGFMILSFIFLISVGAVPYLTFGTAHGILFIIAVVLYIVAEVLATTQRGVFIFFNNTRALNPVLMFLWLLDVASLLTFVSCLGCFRTRQCAGGEAAAPVYEYLFCSFFAIRQMFRLLDVDMYANDEYNHLELEMMQDKNPHRR